MKIFQNELFDFEIRQLWYNDLSLDSDKDILWWEQCKIKFKKLIIRHSRKISESINRKIKDLENKVILYTELALNSNNPTLYNSMVEQIKEDLKFLIENYHEGARIRSRAKFIENHEKSTRHFLQLERRNAKRKFMTEIKDGNITFTNTQDIIGACRNFYQDLFTQEPVDNEVIDEFLINVNLPRLEPHQVEFCEGFITFEETREAIKLMKNNKTPGSDGLPVEFYKKYFYLFGSDIGAAYLENFHLLRD